MIDPDPWGGETGRSSNQAFQPQRYTSYERDANAGDDAMFRRYQSAQSRFPQPDPYDGSYNLTDPQSLNRYAYVQNDPVNFVDPSGLLAIGSCHTVLYVTVDFDTRAQRTYEIQICDTYSGGGFGGFGSGFRGNRSTSPEPEPEKKCDDPKTLNGIASNVIGGTRRGGNVEGYSGSYSQIAGRLSSAGFSRFYTNINPEHWSGNDFQGFVNGNWYHVTVGRPSPGAWQDGGMSGGQESKPDGTPPFIQLHCEPNKPNSIKHLREDYVLPRFWRLVGPLIPTMF
jgi:RHS repeat-associated protein